MKVVADDSATDLRHDRLDVAVRFGRPPLQDALSIASLTDAVFPVCSPKLLNAHGQSIETANLLQLPLIASDTVNPSWLTWRTWAQRVGLGPEIGKASDLSRLRFNHYTDTIQAAVNGEGVALGWAALLKGHLIRLGRERLTLDDAYHLLVPLGRDRSASTNIFVDWMADFFMRGC